MPAHQRACSSAAEQGTHNPLVPGSNPGGPRFFLEIGNLFVQQKLALEHHSDALKSVQDYRGGDGETLRERESQAEARSASSGLSFLKRLTPMMLKPIICPCASTRSIRAAVFSPPAEILFGEFPHRTSSGTCRSRARAP